MDLEPQGVTPTPVEQEAPVWERADEVLRENPVPALITAIVIGFGLGLLVRAFERERHPVRDSFEDASDYLRGLMKPARKKSRRMFSGASSALHDAADKVHEGFDDAVDPIARWWHRLWS